MGSHSPTAEAAAIDTTHDCECTGASGHICPASSKKSEKLPGALE